jgi:PAS domain S-box-containing protein
MNLFAPMDEPQVRPYDNSMNISQDSDELEPTRKREGESDTIQRVLTSAFDMAPDPMLVAHASGGLLAVNRAARALFSVDWDEPGDRTLDEVLPAGNYIESLERELGETGHLRTELAWLNPAGVARTLLVDLSPLSAEHSLIVVRDVTEVRKLEARVRDAERMQSFVRIAGSIVHDLNNVLVPILYYSGAAQAGELDTGESLSMLEDMRVAAERASSLTKRLLSIARESAPAPAAVVALNTTIYELRGLIGTLVGTHVEVVTRLDIALSLVRVDREQLERLLLNLAINARDAMPHGGTLTIETSNVNLGETSTRAPLPSRSGRHVMLSVADTGAGMDDETQRRIFEPFFTTKEPGKGTGLGLASALPFLRQSDGWISVESEPGLGTRFRIYLPAADEPAAG